MLPNAFIGKSGKPSDAELAAELGQTRVLWDQLLTDLAHEHQVATQEWHSYSRKAGWSLRLKHEKRTILYSSPCRGGLRVSLVFGDRAIKAIREGSVPRHVIQLIDGARRYAEGTGVQIEVKGPKDIATIKKLATVKVEH